MKPTTPDTLPSLEPYHGLLSIAAQQKLVLQSTLTLLSIAAAGPQGLPAELLERSQKTSLHPTEREWHRRWVRHEGQRKTWRLFATDELRRRIGGETLLEAGQAAIMLHVLRRFQGPRLSCAQFSLVLYGCQEGGLYLGALKHRTWTSSTNMTRDLRALAERGWVKITEQPGPGTHYRTTKPARAFLLTGQVATAERRAA